MKDLVISTRFKELVQATSLDIISHWSELSGAEISSQYLPHVENFLKFHEVELTPAEAIYGEKFFLAISSLRKALTKALKDKIHEDDIELIDQLIDREFARVLARKQDEIYLYQQFLERAPLPIGIYDGEDQRFTFINKKGLEIIRKTKEEVIGKTYAEVLPEAKERIANIKYVYQTGETVIQNAFPLEVGSVEKGNRTTEFVNFTSQPYLNEAGKIRGVLSFGVIVTEEVLYKKKLEELAFRTSQILESLPAGYFSVDKNWNITYINPAAIPALGGTISELRGQNVWEVHPALVGTEFYHAYHRSMDKKEIVEVTNYYPEQDSWYQTISFPLDDGIAVSFNNITARKKEEEARILSEERFALLSESVPQMVWITDGEGSSIHFNGNWLKRTGTSLEDNLEYGWVNVVHPDDRERASNAWAKATKTQSIYDIEYRVKMNDGTYRWHVARGIPYINQENKITQWFGTTTDIEDQKQAQEELRQAVAARDEFLSVASHELKTPLTSMRLQAQLAKKYIEQTSNEELSGEKLYNHMQFTDRSINKLNRLVDDMLDIARIASGKLNIHREKVDLNKLLTEILDRMSTVLKDMDCKIEFLVEGNATGNWDVFRLEQVFSNLLSNASRYSKGKVITVSLKTSKNKVLVSVKDEGKGIDKKDQIRIFERFERALSPEETSAGLGLGLFIVKQIVEMHDGKIWVESEPGQGAEFFVELPIL